MMLGKTFCIALAGGALLLPATAAAAPWRYVEGEYAQAATCVPSDAKPTSTLTTWEFWCASGSTTWTGDLRGQTVLSNVHGTFDLLTGYTEGTADEKIYLVNEDGRTGTLEMTAVFSADPNRETNFFATNTIVGGSGDFAGAKGTLEFEGDTIGTGEYKGWIKTTGVKKKQRRRRR